MWDIMIHNLRTSIVGIFTFCAMVFSFVQWARGVVSAQDVAIALGTIASLSVTLTSLLAKDGQTQKEHLAEAVEYKHLAEAAECKHPEHTKNYSTRPTRSEETSM